ncbi:MAG TPA: PP2C family serine/threonine-protein phosphatase [Chloroflexia bacterium]|nr:PP2C family serine/threonine-protein phosphatase [Chloroflexia bacterium]
MTTPGSGADAPDDPRSSPRSDPSRSPAPGPPPNPPAAPTPPISAADLRRQRVIRPLAPRPPEPPPAPPGGRHGIIRRLERDPPGARQAGSVIRPLLPLPPNMPGSRDRKTGIIRPLLPLPPLPGSSPEELIERRQQRDERLNAVLRRLEPLPAARPAVPARTKTTDPLPTLEAATVVKWVYCRKCESTNRHTLMFCLQCGAPLPAAAGLYDTLTREYEDMQSAERPKAEILPRMPSGQRGPNWQAYGMTDTGRVRKNNEDTLSATPLPGNGWLLLVADGMGGAEAGEVASQQAAGIVRELVENRMALDSSPDVDHRPWLIQAIEQANELLHHQAEEDPQFHGMGTTTTVGIVQGLCLELGHVGDSRCYRLPARGHLEQLTIDHAIVSHLLRLGQITPDEAKLHPLRNQLYRAVATASTVEVDATLHILDPRDKLLFCSDGLILHVTDAEIEDILRRAKTPHQACKHLIDLTLSRGAGDNVSVIVLMAG